MRTALSVLIGKAVRVLARLRGGGSALPGLVVDRIDPGFLARVLGRLPRGVVAVSGTNGKTSTTKMITELLESQGLRVFTNRTGSNFSRGVVAAAVAESTWRGHLDADVAVLELDEAHAIRFIERVKPRISVLLNVFEDQVERFATLDTTAELLERLGGAATEGLIVNAEDPRVAAIGRRVQERSAIAVRAFGLSPELRRTVLGPDADRQMEESDGRPEPDVLLTLASGSVAGYRIGGEEYRGELLLEGLHNQFNGAAALAAARMVLADALDARLFSALQRVRPAFGRGERLDLDGYPFELVLVKNAAGLRLALASYADRPAATMMALSDRPADGSDVSWVWNVDVADLRGPGVSVVTGSRADLMAERLRDGGVDVGRVEPDVQEALRRFREASPGEPRRVFSSYTAMLELREALGKLARVDNIW